MVVDGLTDRHRTMRGVESAHPDHPVPHPFSGRGFSLAHIGSGWISGQHRQCLQQFLGGASVHVSL